MSGPMIVIRKSLFLWSMIQMRKWAASAKLSGFSYIQWLEGQMSSQTRTGFNLIIEELAFLRVVFLQDDIEA